MHIFADALIAAGAAQELQKKLKILHYRKSKKQFMADSAYLLCFDPKLADQITQIAKRKWESKDPNFFKLFEASLGNPQ